MSRNGYREGDRVLVATYDSCNDRDEREVCIILSVRQGTDGITRYRVRPDDDASFVVRRERIVRRA